MRFHWSKTHLSTKCDGLSNSDQKVSDSQWNATDKDHLEMCSLLLYLIQSVAVSNNWKPLCVGNGQTI